MPRPAALGAILLLLAGQVLAGATPPPPRAPLPGSPATFPRPATSINLIDLDDCAADLDCAFTQTALHHWMDIGAVKVLAFIADSANATSAPVFKVFDSYYGHAGVPIGAFQGSMRCNNGCSRSFWTGRVVRALDKDDSRAAYPPCLTVLRKTLAAAPDHSVVMVETGFPTCLVQLLNSGPDRISPTPGAELIKAKVRALYDMGGDYPNSSRLSGGAEWNFQSDPGDNHLLFATWTAQNGFPPIYLVGFTLGDAVDHGVPRWFPADHPAKVGEAALDQTSRPAWDTMAVYAAIFGTSDFRVGPNGANTVDGSTGANAWSGSKAAGQFYLRAARPASYFERLLDGLDHAGADSWLPMHKAAKRRSPPGDQP